MATYDDVLFPGQDLNTPISIAAANRYIRRIREGLPLEHWRTHDFRRSLSTGASELGGVLAVYNKHDWLDGQLEAYERYADKLTAFLDANDG